MSGGSKRRRRIVATYPYRERGFLSYEVVRFDPKRFALRHPSAEGGWAWGRGHATPILYRLDELRDALRAGKPVVICEGEKDTDNAVAQGYTATTNLGGAGKWRSRYSEEFRGSNSKIGIVAHNDGPGLRHASQVYYSLHDAMALGKIGIYVAKIGNDLSDHLAAGYQLKDLRRVDPIRRDELRAFKGNKTAPADAQGALPRSLQVVLDELGAKGAGENQWLASCPAHDDKRPSLSIAQGENTPVLVYCHAGCTYEEIALALGMASTNFSVLESGTAPISTILMSDIESERVRWLWPGRIPFGKLTILEGDPGTLKSTITLDLAARLSSGRRLPLAKRLEPASVLLVAAEDDAADTIHPRLEAARADMSKVAVVRPKRDREGKVVPTTLPDDTWDLRRLIREHGARLVVIDPVTAYIGEKINTHNDASVRRAMAPLAQVAQETGAAVLLVRHLNKATGQDAMHRGTGSLAFTAAVRSVLVVARHPEDPTTMCLASVKSNLDAPPATITYTIGVDFDRDVPVVEWGAAIGLTANDLLRSPDSRLDAPEREAAEADLAELLAPGPMAQKDVRRHMDEAGHSWSTVKRAKTKIGVRSRQVRSRDGSKIAGWEWCLPVSDDGVVRP